MYYVDYLFLNEIIIIIIIYNLYIRNMYRLLRNKNKNYTIDLIKCSDNGYTCICMFIFRTAQKVDK